MHKAKKLINGIFAAALVIAFITSILAVRARHNTSSVYTMQQQEAVTHNIEAVKNCRSSSLSSSSVSNLFNNLPLGEIDKKFTVDSGSGTLAVTYYEESDYLGEEKVKRNLVYNTIAAISAINNLKEITYNFSDGISFTFSRDKIEEIFGTDLSGILDKETWDNYVQPKIEDETFINQFYE